VTNLTVTAAAEGTGWRTSLTKTQTAAWAAGTVYWQAYAESGSSRVTLGSGQLKVKLNLSAAANSAEFRSQAEQDLAAVEAAMRAMISGGAVQEYSIGGRSLRKIPLAELEVRRQQLKAIVARERKAEMIANGLGNPHNVFVRFTK
jgi:hypothetical protein